MGEYTPITTGLPQGGILSPVLWLMFFNTVHQELTELRVARGDDSSDYEDYIFADDLTTVIVADTERVLQERATANAGDAHTVMRRRFLDVQDEKTQNLVCRPALLPGGVYRRAPPRSALATRTRKMRQYQLEARHVQIQVECGLEGEQVMPSVQELARGGYPYPLTESIKKLGVQIDSVRG